MVCVQCAKAGARCDYGLYVAGTLDNASTVCKLASEAIGLKMYLNETFASLKMDNMMQWLEVLVISLITPVHREAKLNRQNCSLYFP